MTKKINLKWLELKEKEIIERKETTKFTFDNDWEDLFLYKIEYRTPFEYVEVREDEDWNEVNVSNEAYQL